MGIIQTGHDAAETTHKGFITKTVQPCLSNVAGVLVLGAALGSILYIGRAKTAETSHNTQRVSQEDSYSLGCYADDRFFRIMPYVFTDDALTPLVSG